MDQGKIHVDQNMKDPSRNFIESHNDEELVKIAWDSFMYASMGLKSLKEAHFDLPRELEPHAEYYRSLIESSTRFLVDTGNWYKKNS